MLLSQKFETQTVVNPKSRSQSLFPEFDPIEWAVLALIVSGSSLLLALETKIKNQKKAQTEELAKQAKAGNKARLQSIRSILSEMRSIVEHIQKIGKLIENSGDDSLGRFSMEFESAEVQAVFDHDIDRLTELIGKLNRLCNEFDPKGIDLDAKCMEEFVVTPMKQIKGMTRFAIHPDTHPLERFIVVQKLLNEYSGFVDGLERLC